MKQENQEQDYALQQKVFCEIVAEAVPSAKVTFDPNTVGKVNMVVATTDERATVANALKSKWPFEASFHITCTVEEKQDAPTEQEEEFVEETPKQSRMQKLEEVLRQGANKDTFKAASDLTQKFAELAGAFILSATVQPTAKSLITLAKIENGALKQFSVEIDFDTLSALTTFSKAEVENDDDAKAQADAIVDRIQNDDPGSAIDQARKNDDPLMQDS